MSTNNNRPFTTMTRYLISFLILVNTATLAWCGFNYATLSSESTQQAIFKINKMSELSSESLKTMNSYSPEYKQNHVNDIIDHYRQLSEHLLATRDMTIEVTDVLFRYIYIFLALSLLNVISCIFLLVKSRHCFD